jgi:hypothetical protein
VRPGIVAADDVDANDCGRGRVGQQQRQCRLPDEDD